MTKQKEFRNGTRYPILWHGKMIQPGESWIHVYNDQNEEWIETTSKNEVDAAKNKLCKLSFDELREVGYSYGQKDRSRKNLIDEIVNEQIKRGEL